MKLIRVFTFGRTFVIHGRLSHKVWHKMQIFGSVCLLFCAHTSVLLGYWFATHRNNDCHNVLNEWIWMWFCFVLYLCEAGVELYCCERTLKNISEKYKECVSYRIEHGNLSLTVVTVDSLQGSFKGLIFGFHNLTENVVLGSAYFGSTSWGYDKIDFVQIVISHEQRIKTQRVKFPKKSCEVIMMKWLLVAWQTFFNM